MTFFIVLKLPLIKKKMPWNDDNGLNKFSNSYYSTSWSSNRIEFETILFNRYLEKTIWTGRKPQNVLKFLLLADVCHLFSPIGSCYKCFLTFFSMIHWFFDYTQQGAFIATPTFYLLGTTFIHFVENIICMHKIHGKWFLIKF